MARRKRISRFSRDHKQYAWVTSAFDYVIDGTTVESAEVIVSGTDVVDTSYVAAESKHNTATLMRLVGGIGLSAEDVGGADALPPSVYDYVMRGYIAKFVGDETFEPVTASSEEDVIWTGMAQGHVNYNDDGAGGIGLFNCAGDWGTIWKIDTSVRRKLSSEDQLTLVTHMLAGVLFNASVSGIHGNVTGYFRSLWLLNR